MHTAWRTARRWQRYSLLIANRKKCAQTPHSVFFNHKAPGIFLAQILEFHADGLGDGKAVAAAWLGALPLSADEAEATVAHEQLVRLVEASDPRWVSGSWTVLKQL